MPLLRLILALMTLFTSLLVGAVAAVIIGPVAGCILALATGAMYAGAFFEVFFD